MFKKIAFLAVAALALSGCNSTQPTSVETTDTSSPIAETKTRAETLLDASLWTVPWTIQGGEGLSFSLPQQLTYSGGGDTDGWSASWISEKNSTGGSSDNYFTLMNFVLSKCPNGPLGSCSINEWVPATPEEYFDGLVKDASTAVSCSDGGTVPVGNTTGRLFSCDAPGGDVVFFYGSKGAYRANNSLKLLLGEKDLSDSLFKNFLATFKVD